MEQSSPPSPLYLAGIDEAGLGPLLGPLVVGYTLLRVDPTGRGLPTLGKLVNANLWHRLRPLVSDDHREYRERIVVCDSKKLYTPSRGLGPLEGSVLPMLQTASAGKEALDDFRSFWRASALIEEDALDPYPWYRERELPLPRKAYGDKLSIRAELLADQLAARGLKLCGMGVLPVLVGEFNRLLEVHQNKSDAHCSGVCAVIGKLWDRAGNLAVACDRLGARMYYKEALQVHLKPDSIEPVHESPQESLYRLERVREGVRQRMVVRFTVKGDVVSFPVAAASMAAKYTRELCMELFNRYFANLQPGLKRTAGYVTDGRRFLKDTEQLRREREIPDQLLIRKR